MSRLIQLCAAWLTLLSLLLSAEGVGSFATALVAGVDGQHEVSIVDRSATQQVVLHHGASCHGALHRHSWTTRLATGLSKADRQTESDHVFSFARLTTVTGADQRASASAEAPPATTVIEIPSVRFEQSRSGFRLDRGIPAATRRTPQHLVRGTKCLVV